MNIGFEAMSYEIPQYCNTVQELVSKTGFEEEMTEKLEQGGLLSIPINVGGRLDQLVHKAVSKLLKQVPDVAERATGIILAHSLPFTAPSEISFLDYGLEKLGLDNINRFHVSGQPCSIIHRAIQISETIINKEPKDKGILLIGADQANCIEERLFFNSAMGDAAFAGFITKEAQSNCILSSVTEAEIIACEGELSPEENISEFRYKNPSLIRHCIESALKNSGTELDDIKYIIPHTSSKSIWDIIAKLMKIPRQKILDDFIANTGHLNSNDSICHYIRACDEGILNKGDTVALINPGFGGVRGCTVIKV